MERKDIAEVLEFLEKPPGAAEACLGDVLDAKTFRSKPLNDDEKRQLARNWFGTQFKKIADILCSDELIHQHLFGAGKKDRNAIIASIIDLLGAFAGLVPVTALTAMVIHYGLEKLCNE